MTTQLKLKAKRELAPLAYVCAGIFLFVGLLYLITLGKNSFVDLFILGMAIMVFFELPGYFIVHPLKLNLLERFVIAAPVSIGFNSTALYLINSLFLIKINIISVLAVCIIPSLICFLTIIFWPEKETSKNSSSSSEQFAQP